MGKNFKTSTISKNKNSKTVKPSKPLLTKPSISKFTSKDNISKNGQLNPPQIISKSKSPIEQKNSSSISNNKQYENKVRERNKLSNKNDQFPKSPKPPIQLIEKPKNV